ncbi:hypothetical protein [Flavobacterium flavigenum]|uniref:hypothetical protein n=1 Tax=Flavobacterium flavigenum TaxID=3003258 RepID=UPI0022AC3F3C|nr:hypothetical protein [Flavobacterium flavigenum]
MNRIIEKLTNHLVKKPKTLFLIDSIGAFLTALLLFAVLQNLTKYFGMPKTTLTILWSIAAFFCLYSALCFLLLKEKWRIYIRIISFANLLYCVLILIFLFIHYEQITALGLIYFSTETAIICILVYVELNVAAKILKNNYDNQMIPGSKSSL